MRTRTRIVVTGLVQGVFFRDSVRRRAAREGVTGWVENRPDGAVEAVFEGTPAAVERMVEFARHGPRGARVDSVETFDEPPESIPDFSIR
jgi:acylphosphatase